MDDNENKTPVVFYALLGAAFLILVIIFILIITN